MTKTFPKSLAHRSLTDDYARLWTIGQPPPDISAFLEQVGADACDGLDIMLLDQRLRWRQGCPLAVETYFDTFAEMLTDQRHRLALVYGEFAQRRRLGQNPDFEDVRRKFPELYQLHLRLEADGVSERWRQVRRIDPDAPFSLDDYTVEQVIGGGGMGRVHKARRKVDGRLVAIKILKEYGGSPLDTVNRFLREGWGESTLRHPNIVAVHGVGRCDDGGYFLVMDLFEGANLDSWMMVRGLFPFHQIVEIVATVADAVEHAHSHGVIHRDLKPSNVLLNSSGWTMVTDFGIAQWMKQETDGAVSTGRVYGTPNYMSPEQGNPDLWGKVGPRSDVYGLGALLYALLTGRPPYIGNSYKEVWTQVVDTPFRLVDPGRLRPGIPKHIEAVCRRCLNKVASQRYNSAGEVAAALR